MVHLAAMILSFACTDNRKIKITDSTIKADTALFEGKKSFVLENIIYDSNKTYLNVFIKDTSNINLISWYLEHQFSSENSKKVFILYFNKGGVSNNFFYVNKKTSEKAINLNMDYYQYYIRLVSNVPNFEFGKSTFPVEPIRNKMAK